MQAISTPVAYILWCLGLFGVCGIHRLYAGQVALGLIYLFTFGIFGFGQLIDLILIPGMVDERNRQLRRLRGDYGLGQIPTLQEPPVKTVSPMQTLLRAAKDNGGSLSLAQAALFTEMEISQVEPLLKEAVKVGYAHIGNDPETGAVRYYFDL